MKYEEFIFHLKRKIKTTKKEIMYVCIGSSKILWDSVGPRVGTLLKKEMDNVIGDMEVNFCSKKDYFLNYIKLKGKYIIAIDAAFINEKTKDDIFITNNSIKMGAGLNKNIGKIGNIGIKALISNTNDLNENKIKKISNFIADGIKSLGN